MNILVTGATGFIASQIVTDLIYHGHSVTCCVRDIAHAKNLFPQAKAFLQCNFITHTTRYHWINHLKDIDIVINCVGILYHPNKKIIWDIHYHSPRALFDACVSAGIKKIIQISALGIELSDTEYAKSKKAADDYLLKLPIKSIILRPSLVYGHGSYGGTSLFRGLAGLPWITPIPGSGTQEFQPIHIQDLSKSILRLIEKPFPQPIVLDAAGPTRIQLNKVLTTLRDWLGFGKTKLLHVPLAFIHFLTFLGDFIPYSAINSTSYKMLLQNNITSKEKTKEFQDGIGFVPRDFITGIYHEPSTVQDHWHAKLYFLKPLLIISIAFIWIFTALCSLFFYSKSNSYLLLTQIKIPLSWQPILLYGASIINALLGIAMLFHYKLKQVCILQMMMIIIYSAIITWQLPNLWLEPFAPVAKNIPIFVAILLLLAMESDR